MAYGVGLFEAAIRFVVKDRKAVTQMRELGSATQKTGKIFKKTKEQFADMAGSFVMLAVGSRILKGMTAFIKKTAEIQFGFEKLGALANLGSKQMAQYQQVIMRAAETTAFDLKQTTDAMITLYRATNDMKSSAQALKPALDIAQASMGKMTPEASANMVAMISKGFGKTGEDLATASAQVFAAAKVAGVGIEEFANVQGKLAQAASSAGQSFEQVTAAYALGRRLGYSSQRSATQMMRLFRELSSGKVRETLGSRWIQLIGDYGSGQMKDMRAILGGMLQQTGTESEKNIMRDLMQRGSGISSASQQALSSIVTALRQGISKEGGGRVVGIEAFDYMMGQMEGGKARNTVKRFAGKYVATLDTQLKLLNQSFTNLGVKLGEIIGPAILPFVKAIAAAATAIKDFIVNAGPIAKFLIKVGALTLMFGAAVWASKAAFHGLAGVLRVVQINLYGTAGAANAAAMGGAKATGAFAGFGNIMNSRVLTGIQRVGMAMRSVLKVGGIFLLIEGVQWLYKKFQDPTFVKGFSNMLPGVEEASKRQVNSLKAIAVQAKKVSKDPLIRKMWFLQKAKAATVANKPWWMSSSAHKMQMDNIKAQEAVLLRSLNKRIKMIQGGAKEVNKYLRLGTKELNRLVDKIHNMAKTPPRINLALVTALRQRLAAQAGKRGAAGIHGKAGLGQLSEADVTIKRLIAGEDVSPAEFGKLQAHLARALITYTAHAPARAGAAFASRYGEKVLDPAKAAMGAENIARTQELALMAGGKVQAGRKGLTGAAMSPAGITTPFEQALGLDKERNGHLKKLSDANRRALIIAMQQRDALYKMAGIANPHTGQKDPVLIDSVTLSTSNQPG